MWKIYFAKQAQKDAKKLASAGLKKNAQALLDVIKENPFQNPPPTTHNSARPLHRCDPGTADPTFKRP